jgi:hypothetical protein
MIRHGYEIVEIGYPGVNLQELAAKILDFCPSNVYFILVVIIGIVAKQLPVSGLVVFIVAIDYSCCGCSAVETEDCSRGGLSEIDGKFDVFNRIAVHGLHGECKSLHQGLPVHLDAFKPPAGSDFGAVIFEECSGAGPIVADVKMLAIDLDLGRPTDGIGLCDVEEERLSGCQRGGACGRCKARVPNPFPTPSRPQQGELPRWETKLFKTHQPIAQLYQP